MVESAGPSASAGIKPGDLIVAMNGAPVENVDDLHRYLSEWPIGQPVEIDLIRGRSRQIQIITPQEATHVN